MTTAPSRRNYARQGAKRSSTSFARACRTASISFPACSSKATRPSRPSQSFSSRQAQLDGAEGRTGGGARLAGACILVAFRRYRGGRWVGGEPLGKRGRVGRKQP